MATVVNAKEVETLSLLLGWKELKAMNGFKAIIEGNSVLTFQWRSISLHYLWHLADWVEEIHYISSMTIFSFSHVFRGSLYPS